MNRTSRKIHAMVGVAILCAVVVVLQLLGSFIRFGPVSINLVLVPIVVGAAVYGPFAGALLGCAAGVVILCQPDTSFFFTISPLGTVLTVLLKGMLSGYLSGLVFRALAGKSVYFGALLAALICPVVNTGVFFGGCALFFWDGIAKACGGDALNYIITVMIGVNFLVELGVNLLLSPGISTLVRAKRKS